MATIDYPSWNQLESVLLSAGAVSRYQIPGSDILTLYWSGSASVLGVEIDDTLGEALQNRIRSLSAVAVVTDENGTNPRIFTGSRQLFREFYGFVLDVADFHMTGNSSIGESISHVLDNLEGLFRTRPQLSETRIVGLLGELLFVEAMIPCVGEDAVDSWVGPLSEPHDFRHGGWEYEIKSTTLRDRIHTIHSLQQLYPSAGHQLVLVSVQFMPSGGTTALTLPALVGRLRGTLRTTQARAKFDQKLFSCEYRDDDGYRYEATRYEFRSETAFIPVDDEFPRFPKEATAINRHLANRLSSVLYTVDVGGLGCQQNAARTCGIVPARFQMDITKE